MTVNHLHYDVAVIGGGITGLTAAWTLQQQEPPLTYALLESSNRWGGKILTDELPTGDDESFIFEGGPDSFITQKPWALQLARALGMSDRLLPTNDDRRRTYVLNRGRPVPLPDGVMLIVPTRFTPFVTSPLISLPGKLRMGLDWFIPPKTDGGDETLSDFITRRLGAEALDKIAEPLLAGIYNAEAEKQSVLATFPRFRAIEETHGSLIRGMLAAKKAHPQPSPNGHHLNGHEPAGPKPPSAFISFRGGMGELVQGLLEQLDGDLQLNAPVVDIARHEDRYRLTLANGRTLSAAAVILSVPAYTAAKLLQSIAPEAAAGLEAVRYVSTGTVSLAFRRDEFSHPLDGFGVVIPRSEGRQINAVTWTSTKFDYRTPKSHVLLRAFFGGSRTPHMMALPDDELLALVRTELRAIMGIDTEPAMHRIYRWFDANPQYDVGHLERVAEIEGLLPVGVFLAGSAYRGIGIPDCVRQGGEAAERAGRHLQAITEHPQEGIRV